MTDPQWTILKALRWTADYFRDKGLSEPRTSAEVLLAHALGLSRLDLYLRYDQPLTPEELARFKALVVRRRQGEPVAYLTGRKEFWSLDFQVAPGVLIPRPETEILVQTALEAAKIFLETAQKTKNRKQKTASLWGLEIGVGSGAVAVALAKELPRLHWLALDLCVAALAVARENVRRHGVLDRINLVRSDLLSGVKPRPWFALLAANLPYVPRAEWERLPKEIKDYEPPEALLGGEDGLDLIRTLIRQAPSCLLPGGFLTLEVGHDQAAAVVELLQQTGEFTGWETRRDLLGIPRVVLGRRSAT